MISRNRLCFLFMSKCVSVPGQHFITWLFHLILCVKCLINPRIILGGMEMQRVNG